MVQLAPKPWPIARPGRNECKIGPPLTSTVAYPFHSLLPFGRLAHSASPRLRAIHSSIKKSANFHSWLPPTASISASALHGCKELAVGTLLGTLGAIEGSRYDPGAFAQRKDADGSFVQSTVLLFLGVLGQPPINSLAKFGPHSSYTILLSS